MSKMQCPGKLTSNSGCKEGNPHVFDKKTHSQNQLDIKVNSTQTYENQ